MTEGAIQNLARALRTTLAVEFLVEVTNPTPEKSLFTQVRMVRAAIRGLTTATVVEPEDFYGV